MIEANELRIGNMLQIQLVPNGPWRNIVIKGIKVQRGDQFIAWTEHSGEFMLLKTGSFKPITVTQKILENCGFEPDANPCFYFIVLPLNIASLSINPDNGVCYLIKNSCSINPFHVNFLHELQNLFFALSGEELNIPLL